MSTQLWWLLLTRYQPRRRSPSRPRTSQRMRWTIAIHQPFTAIQPSARAFSARSTPRRAAPKGRASFTRARGIIPEKMARALAASTEPATLPLKVDQRRFSIRTPTCRAPRAQCFRISECQLIGWKEKTTHPYRLSDLPTLRAPDDRLAPAQLLETRLADAEVVGDFVDDRGGDLLPQVILVRAVLQEGPAVQGDAGRQVAALRPPFRQRPPRIQPVEGLVLGHAQVIQQRVRRPVLDDDRHTLEVRSELLRHEGQRLVDQVPEPQVGHVHDPIVPPQDSQPIPSAADFDSAGSRRRLFSH